MWNKPWMMKEGFAMGGGLMALGVVLQLVAGPVAWSAFAWPVNGILMAALLALIGGAYMLRKRVYALQFMSQYRAAVPAMALVVALTLVMGLTKQQPDGTWVSNMLSCWPFVLIYVYTVLILGLSVINRCATFRPTLKNISFVLYIYPTINSSQSNQPKSITH